MAAGHAKTSGVPPTASSADVYAPTAKNATAPRLTSPAMPHWTLRPRVSSAGTQTSGAMAGRRAIGAARSRWRAGGAGGAREQRGGDGGEAARCFVRGRHQERPHLFHDADDKRAGGGPGGGADATENRGRKDRDDEAG